jgi:hypothetical protein
MAWLDAQAWDIGPLIKTIIGAGFGSALVQALLPMWREKRQQKSHAAYMAMRLAVILESYASACVEFNAANANAEPSPDDEYPNVDTTLPALPPYPDDAEGWRAIDRRLAARCLGLPTRIWESGNAIKGTIEFISDDLEYVLPEQAAGLGLEAWKLAAELRRKHGVEQLATDWDYAAVLQSTLDKAHKRKNSAG